MRRWPGEKAVHLGSLAFPCFNITLGVLYECTVGAPSPQPRCPDAPAWLPLVAWSILGAQALFGAALAWTGAPRWLWIPVQLAFLVVGYWAAVGAILSAFGA